MGALAGRSLKWKTENMPHKIIDGKKHAQVIKDDVKLRVDGLKALGWHPRLVSVHIGESDAAALFIKNQKRNCEEVGIDYESRGYPTDITQREALAAIHALNADPRVSGIILQRPVPRTLDLEELENA